MLKNERVLPLVETPTADNDGSKSVEISQLDDIWLYKATMEKLLNLIKAEVPFSKNRNNSAPLHIPTF